jgi:hypothetical protein
MHDALLQIELRDRQIEALKEELAGYRATVELLSSPQDAAALRQSISEADPRVLVGEIAPPPPQRQLPAPTPHQPPERWGWNPIVGGPSVPGLANGPEYNY